MSELTHLDDTGAARMVDVSAKDITAREAMAEAIIVLSAQAFDAANSGTAKKGDVLATARIAGIMAAKKTHELIPLCHPLPISKAEIHFAPLETQPGYRITATVKTVSQTGVEMEALTAASIAALTIYDMLKAVDKGAHIEGVRLLAKTGGKSGSYHAPRESTDDAPKPPSPAPRRSAPAASPLKLNPKRASPTAIMNEVSAPRPTATQDRESFRSFMVDHRLRATEWAKQADVPVSQLYAFLTGRARNLSADLAERLANAAGVRVEDLFGRKK